eukprot:m.127875 g.127875  ORF g.127875 m.127875 type:complete len:63 (+) comp13614_c0_seq3:1931-2119(+)
MCVVNYCVYVMVGEHSKSFQPIGMTRSLKQGIYWNTGIGSALAPSVTTAANLKRVPISSINL